MECPKCRKRGDIIVQYYYSDGTGAFTILKLDGVATLCGSKPAIWEKTEYRCFKCHTVIQTLGKSMDIRG